MSYTIIGKCARIRGMESARPTVTIEFPGHILQSVGLYIWMYCTYLANTHQSYSRLGICHKAYTNISSYMFQR